MAIRRWLAAVLIMVCSVTLLGGTAAGTNEVIQSEGLVYIPERSVYFADVDQSLPWAFMEIDYLANARVVSGTGDCEFSPMDSLRRADFVVMLYQAYGMSDYVNGSSGFSDVSDKAYYSNALSAARNLGIIYGDSEGRFRPEDPLTRQDAMVILRRTLDKTGLSFQSGSLSAFSDANSVASYARNDVAALVNANIISGSGGKLRPEDTVSRAEMAVMLYRALQLEQGSTGAVYRERDDIVNLCVGSTIYSHVVITNMDPDQLYVGLFQCNSLRRTDNGYEVTLGDHRDLDQEIAWSDGDLLVNGVSISVAQGCEAICIEPYGFIQGSIPATGGIYSSAAVSLVNGMATTIYYSR